MEFKRKLKGTPKEMVAFFEDGNTVRFYETIPNMTEEQYSACVQNNEILTYRITMRVAEDFVIPSVRTIQAMHAIIAIHHA